MARERTGEAFEFDEKLTVVGDKLEPGSTAPDFELDFMDPSDSTMKTVRLSDSAGTVRLLNVVNSIDTPVCHIETRRWDNLRRELPDSVQLYTISMDLPFALSRWQSAENVGHPTLSAHRDTQFGIDYGVLIKEWRLLQRAVFVIDGAGRVAHAQYVNDQMLEPSYREAIDAARSASQA
jgi:thioredoxin-dependent peroxiredoxin